MGQCFGVQSARGHMPTELPAVRGQCARGEGGQHGVADRAQRAEQGGRGGVPALRAEHDPGQPPAGWAISGRYRADVRPGQVSEGGADQAGVVDHHVILANRPDAPRELHPHPPQPL